MWQRRQAHALGWGGGLVGTAAVDPSVRLGGFFEGTFAGAMSDWLAGDPDYAFITEWKGKRAEFERGEIADIRRYNAAELRCLKTIMERLRETLRSLDIRITRWDGAGAVA